MLVHAVGIQYLHINAKCHSCETVTPGKGMVRHVVKHLL